MGDPFPDLVCDGVKTFRLINNRIKAVTDCGGAFLFPS